MQADTGADAAVAGPQPRSHVDLRPEVSAARAGPHAVRRSAAAALTALDRRHSKATQVGGGAAVIPGLLHRCRRNAQRNSYFRPVR
jgi:hypothetical protein